jgi:MFS superfamily sulfate permease-like transporter
MSHPEFRHSLVAMLGVMTVGVLPGVLIAVGLALVKLLSLASRPHDAVLGIVEDKNGFYTASEEQGGRTIPGLIIYRFGSSLVFFNADYFKERARTLISGANPRPMWFLLDAESMPFIDVTGADALEELRRELARQDIVLAVARPRGLFRVMLERTGVADRIGAGHIFPTVHAGVEAFFEAVPKRAS